jgi:serpin B
MNRSSLVRNAALSLPIALAACSSGSAGKEVESQKTRATPTVSASDLTAAATGERDLGIDLYKNIAASGTGNVFLSPHSISEALTMVYAGAATDTASQLRTVLHAQLPDAQLFPAMNGLDLALESRGQGEPGDDGAKFQLNVANALWGQEGFTFEQPFLDTLAVDYGAGVHLVDFEKNAEGARTTINTWVADQTNQKITNLLPEGAVDSTTRLTITNAVYFNAAWQTAFDKSATAPAAFTTDAGAAVQVPTMHNVFTSTGLIGNGVTAVEIPYAGDQLSMIVVQPDDLATFESQLSGDSLEALIGQLAPAQVTLSLPEWKFTNTNSLGGILKSLGATDAFTPGVADFSGIDGAHDLFIQDVLHKAYVGVDESGTEAAAATAITVGGSAVEQTPPALTVTIDKPFLFVIRDNATGACVFLGRVTDPTAS